MAESTTVTITEADAFKQKALRWAHQFGVVCLLDSNEYQPQRYTSLQWKLAVDEKKDWTNDVSLNYFSDLKSYLESKQNAVFGFLSYDLKNEFEKLYSANQSGIDFPTLFFFEPRYTFEIIGDKLTVNRNYPETFELLETIQNFNTNTANKTSAITLQSRTERDIYLQQVNKIRRKIEEGDFYEINYCNEFYSEGKKIDPISTYLSLNKKAKAPFSAFFKLHNKYIICASPERFLKKEGSKLISQPIKGTCKKGGTKRENELLQQTLKNDIKERAENVMIVDLVRNDLAKSSKAGSVKVEELFGIYEFETVNHMISTVVSEADNNQTSSILQHAFPMGSMTGAPKVEVMKNIEAFENFKRGIFSGSIGYIAPNGDFDFNVVIRSIFYDDISMYVSVPVGGAITYDSVPESEWEELILKAKAMVDVLNTTA